MTTPPTLDNCENTYPLTAKDRQLLQKTYLLHWTVFKWMLISFGLVFLFAWLWMGWIVHFNPKLKTPVDQGLSGFFLFFSCALAVIGLLAALTTRAYKKRVAMPLAQDLREARKVRKIGTLVAIESAGENTSKLVFKSNSAMEVEDFIIQKGTHFSDDGLNRGREILLEHTPHARILLQVRFLLPLTLEQEEQQKVTQRYGVVFVCVLVGVLELGFSINAQSGREGSTLSAVG
jgi:hypothetical protein